MVQAEKRALVVNIYLQAAEIKKLKLEKESLVNGISRQDRPHEPEREQRTL